MSRPDPEAGIETTSDSWLGGKLVLRQPAKGHRVGSDAALLAAAAPRAERIVDVGAGIGAVGLALLARMADAKADLVEIDSSIAALAAENVAANGFAGRARVVVADVAAARSRRAGGLAEGAADLVVTNPPYFEAPDVRVSPDGRRARAHVFAREDEGRSALAAWIVGALALLAPGGRFVMIHRPEALAEILASFGKRLGAVAVLPIYPYADAPARRVLIAGVKGARGPLRVMPGLVLHEKSGVFTKEAEALHRGETTIPLVEDRRGEHR